MDTHNKWIFLLFCSLCLHISAQEIQNPILPGVADAGVVKYNANIILVEFIQMEIFIYQMTWFIGESLYM